MAVQRDNEGFVKPAEQELDKEGHTHTCAWTHTQGTRQYRFKWQYNGMAVGDSHCGDIQTQQASGSVLCVSSLYVHTPVSPAALICHGYRWLLCHHETLLFGYDRHFAAFVRGCLCGWYDKLAKRLNYTPAANSPNEYAFTVDVDTRAHSRDI